MTPPLWPDERIQEWLDDHWLGVGSAEALAGEMREEYEPLLERLRDRVVELEAQAAAPQWERIPDGTYVTRHGDGIISYGGDQLSVSKRQKRMAIFVGTLPDGWELHRRVRTEPTP